MRRSFQMRSSSSCRVARVSASSALNGSSISSTLGLHGQPAGHRHALAHAARELARALGGGRRQVDERDELLGEPRRAAAGWPGFTASTARATFSYTVIHGSSEYCWKTMPRSGPGSRDRRAVEDDAAGVGRQEAGDQRDQRGLAGARVADDGDELAFLHGQVDAAEHVGGAPRRRRTSCGAPRTSR